MELKLYLRLLINKWWILLPTFVVTVAATILLTFTQAPVYQAAATFVVGPTGSSEDIRDFFSGLDVLSRRAEIAGTYAEVADSRLIKQLAAEDLGLSSEQRKTLSVGSRLLAGTNVLEITVLGNDPVLVKDFAVAVGDQTVAYVQGLYEAYELTPLDRPTVPTSPIEPKKGRNLALGAVLGLVLGAGLAFLSEYLQAPEEPATGAEEGEEIEKPRSLVIPSWAGGAAGWIVAGLLALLLIVGCLAVLLSGRGAPAAAVPAETPKVTVEATATATYMPAASPTNTSLPTAKPTGTPTSTPTLEPSPTPQPTNTPTLVPAETATPGVPTATLTSTPTQVAECPPTVACLDVVNYLGNQALTFSIAGGGFAQQIDVQPDARDTIQLPAGQYDYTASAFLGSGPSVDNFFNGSIVTEPGNTYQLAFTVVNTDGSLELILVE